MTDYSYKARQHKLANIIECASDAAQPRTSTLELSRYGITVLGNLPHGYVFRPTNRIARDRLVTYLENLHYDSNGEHFTPEILGTD